MDERAFNKRKAPPTQAAAPPHDLCAKPETKPMPVRRLGRPPLRSRPNTRSLTFAAANAPAAILRPPFHSPLRAVITKRAEPRLWASTIRLERAALERITAIALGAVIPGLAKTF